MKPINFHLIPRITTRDYYSEDSIDNLNLSEIYESTYSLALGTTINRKRIIKKLAEKLVFTLDRESEHEMTWLDNLIKAPQRNARNYLEVNHNPDLSQAGLYFGLK